MLLVLPTGRDAALAQNALAAAELSCEPCSGLGELADRLHGAAGVILAEEALRHSGPLFAALDAEPPGSALPVCVLLARRGPTPAARFALRALERHPKVLPSFLARPCTPAALVGAARAGLRARQTQERLRAATARLEGEVRRRDEFLAMLGHELRNPVSSIAYVAEMLERPEGVVTTDMRLWGASLIARQVRHVTGLLDELLDIARVRSGKIALKREPLDLRSVVEQSVETFRAAAAGHRFDRSVPDEPVPVVGDRMRLTQVVNNLLDNAFKYTDSGGSVALELAIDRDAAVLAVVDEGRGIRPDALEHIFEPFYQDGGERAGTRGFGLGLAMVQQIVRLHEGSIHAESGGERRGARFTVRLPLASRRQS